MRRYDDMIRITSQLSDVAVSHISNEFMEVTVRKSHSLRFFYDAETLRVRHVEVRPVRSSVPLAPQ